MGLYCDTRRAFVQLFQDAVVVMVNRKTLWWCSNWSEAPDAASLGSERRIYGYSLRRTRFSSVQKCTKSKVCTNSLIFSTTSEFCQPDSLPIKTKKRSHFFLFGTMTERLPLGLVDALTTREKACPYNEWIRCRHDLLERQLSLGLA